MIAVIQRVKNASVKVDNNLISCMDCGMLVYYSVEKDDTLDMIEPFLDKLVHLRIFEDENKKMNLTVERDGKNIMFISQFTIAANLDRGNRPDFASAMRGEEAKVFYLNASEVLKSWGYNVFIGSFGEHMEVEYINDGPVTFVLDSKKLNRFKKKC